jgi:poly(A) polymerase
MEMDKYAHSPETHPEGGVLTHTLEALKQNTLKDPIINLAILLHDIGKPKTYKQEGDKISYIGHAEEGVDIINQIADRLRMDNKTREALIYAAVNHMKFHDILDMSTNKVVNLINNDHWNVLYAVAFADSAARRGLFDEEEWNKIIAKIEKVSKEYQGKKSIANIKKVIDGNWIMQLKGLPQGPEVGKVINATVTWVLDNNIDINDTDKIKQYILSL